MNKNNLARRVALGVFLILLLALYFSVAIFYSSRFMPNSYINERDVSNLKAQQVDQLNYALTVYDKENTPDLVTGAEIDFSYITDIDTKELLHQQKSFLWPATMFMQKNYEVQVEVSYDSAKLAEAVDNLKLMKNEEIIEAEDAHVDFVGKSAVIAEEIIGRRLDRNKIHQEVVKAIEAGEAELYLTDYEQLTYPKITADNKDLVKEVENWNLLAGIEIVHEFSSQKRVLDEETIREWVTVDDGISVNRDQVYEYVLSLAREFNTFGTNRPFVDSHGRSIEIKGGDYGWILNKEKETDALVELIEGGKSAVREPIYEATAATHDGVDTSEPNTYVEIDLTGQHLWYYKDGSLKVESDIVSGTFGKNPTREGTFAVMYKDRDTNLVGETWDRPVNYFIPFYTDVGLHDASWRPAGAFGGTTYLTNGSKGCINMPLDKVEQIYNQIEKGTIVYCYY